MKRICLFVGGDFDGERLEVDSTIDVITLRKPAAHPKDACRYVRHTLGVHAVYVCDVDDGRDFMERLLAGYEPGN